MVGSSPTGTFGVAFSAMACRCEVRLPAADEAEACALAQPAIDEVLRIEAKYSRYRQDSVVSRINAAAGADPVAIDEESAALLAYADALWRNSDGLFDISAGILRRAWDFRAGMPPSADQLAALLPLIGWNKVEREAARIRLPRAGMELDFGGFGKEYAADRAAALLRAQGISSGYVNLGGDLHVIGPPVGRAWAIGIQHPRRPEEFVAELPITAGALATSGDYERYFDYQGRRYCHILDPRDGQPVNYWRSVSVFAPLAVAAGSVATIAMLKQRDGLAFLEAAGVGYLAIDDNGLLHSRDVAP